MTLLDIGAHHLYRETGGEGDPVLMLHGGFYTLEPLRPQFDALSERFEVHAYERPGHGRSPDIEGEYTFAAMVDGAVAYLDAAGIGAAHLVGFSDGAIVALLLALRHPDRVLSLVAISANLSPDGFRTNDLEADLQAAGVAPAGRPDREREAYDHYSPDGPEHAEIVLDKLRRLWGSEPDIDPADLAGVTAPSLIIAGDRDAIRTDHTVLIAESIPGAQLCIVPGTTHGLIDQKPDFITFVVRQFLESSG